MKKIIGCFLCLMFLALIVVASVQAYSFTLAQYAENPAFMVGQLETVPPGVGKYDAGDLNQIINGWNNEYEDNLSTLLEPSYLILEWPDEKEGVTTYTFTGLNFEYLTIKYDGVVDLIYLDGQNTYTWVTNSKYTLSHAIGWNSVPDASVTLLLGSSLLGLGLFTRKRKRS